jgi:hypothetical protein
MTLDESGMKWNEHTIDFSQLDLERSKDVAKLRGFNPDFSPGFSKKDE